MGPAEPLLDRPSDQRPPIMELGPTLHEQLPVAALGAEAV
jgi:hypothetical protein